MLCLPNLKLNLNGLLNLLAPSFFLLALHREHYEVRTLSTLLIKNAITYSSYNADIRVGENPIHSNLTIHQSGDVIRFRFQPQTKKLLIDLHVVRN